MADAGTDELPSPAREVLDGVRSRAERLEAALREVLDLETDGEQPRLRHWRRMRLLGESSVAHGLPEERRADLEKSSGSDGPFLDINVLRVDGWTLDAESQLWPPEDPRVVLGYQDIAPSSDPRAVVMDDESLHVMIRALSKYLAKYVPKLKRPLSAPDSLTTSVAAAREGMRLLIEGASLAKRERDPDQRERRHARRLELIGFDMAPPRGDGDRT